MTEVSEQVHLCCPPTLGEPADTVTKQASHPHRALQAADTGRQLSAAAACDFASASAVASSVGGVLEISTCFGGFVWSDRMRGAGLPDLASMHFWNAAAQLAGHCANPKVEGISGAGGMGGGTCAIATTLSIVNPAATTSVLKTILHSPAWNAHQEAG